MLFSRSDQNVFDCSVSFQHTISKTVVWKLSFTQTFWSNSLCEWTPHIWGFTKINKSVRQIRANTHFFFITSTSTHYFEKLFSGTSTDLVWGLQAVAWLVLSALLINLWLCLMCALYPIWHEGKKNLKHLFLVLVLCVWLFLRCQSLLMKHVFLV